MGFGKSKAKLLTEAHGRVTFEDVAGVDEAKEDLQEIVEFLRDPQKFQRLGGRIPRGCLLVGPPGTGKTLIARAVAGEANVPFFTISARTSSRCSSASAHRASATCSTRRRRMRPASSSSTRSTPSAATAARARRRQRRARADLNQLLVEMDGFEANEGIIIIAATNRPDVLDPALLRPGRFDRQIVVPNPDVIGRERILACTCGKVPLAPDVDLKVIARGTPGFSGADLMNLVNEAALLAARRGKRIVTMHEFEDAKDKVMMGAERRTLVMTDDEKRLTAYHEAGHAIVALNVPATDPVHKATIIPRGRALGMVMQLPERDKLSMSFEQMTSRLAIMMGGRIAEEMTFGHDKVTSGAQSDIEQATRLARMMVTRWGFSPELGTVAYGENQDEVFLGMSVARQQNVSEATAQKIDGEVRRLVEEGLGEARRLLSEHREDLRTSPRAARVRDPVRRRDPRSPERQAAGPRHGRAARARPGRRRSPPPAAAGPARRRRAGAAAAGVSPGRSLIDSRAPAETIGGCIAFRLGTLDPAPTPSSPGGDAHAPVRRSISAARRRPSAERALRHGRLLLGAGAGAPDPGRAVGRNRPRQRRRGDRERGQERAQCARKLSGSGHPAHAEMGLPGGQADEELGRLDRRPSGARHLAAGEESGPEVAARRHHPERLQARRRLRAKGHGLVPLGLPGKLPLRLRGGHDADVQVAGRAAGSLTGR
jgi:ATP-dependent Zn protease